MGIVHILIEMLLVLAPLAVAGVVMARLGKNNLAWGFGLGVPSTIASVWLATWALGKNGLSWPAVGLSSPESFWRAGLWCLGAVVLVSTSIAIARSIAVGLTGGPPSTPDRFAVLRGNVGLTVLVIVGVWAIAAFGEELIFRGYLLNRLAEVLPNGGLGLSGAVVLSAAVFGAAHAPSGMVPVAASFAAGLAYGVIYLLSGRSLWVTVIAHGVVDSLAILGAVYGRSQKAV
jgi:membrane protease YdiL (CAAX protease family)